MKKYRNYETNTEITKHDDGSITYEHLNISPCKDFRSWHERIFDQLFYEMGYLVIPFLTVTIMSAGFLLVMLIAVIAKWIVTGTPF